MQFLQTQIAGVFLIKAEKIRDARGFFARLSCPEEFASAGISFDPLQTSIAHNLQLHTLRGMHYSRQAEAKLVRCVRGEILDVVFDIRHDSKTFGQSIAFKLNASNLDSVYIASGLAHGYLTLEPNTDVLYEIDQIFDASLGNGLRWNDPLFSFPWPMAPAVISERDSTYSNFSH
jgi:dTDP-4-dehydrorhamnose 3,5-epimerase